MKLEFLTFDFKIDSHLKFVVQLTLKYFNFHSVVVIINLVELIYSKYILIIGKSNIHYSI